MTQLADLQFIGYRNIFEDIEKSLCTFSSLPETKKKLEPYGGLLGRTITLEHEINVLKERIRTLEKKIPCTI